MAQFPLLSFISRLEKRERIILYVTAVIVSFMLLDRFVVSQILSKMSQLDKKIEDQEGKTPILIGTSANFDQYLDKMIKIY